jgi:hypothetical protein
MEILGYIGFAVLIFLAVTWTISVRVELGAGVHTIVGALFFLVAAIILSVSGANRLHSLWLIPAGFVLTVFLALARVHLPAIFWVARLVGSAYAMLIRVGIPEEKIRAALQADMKATMQRWEEKLEKKE